MLTNFLEDVIDLRENLVPCAGVANLGPRVVLQEEGGGVGAEDPGEEGEPAPSRGTTQRDEHARQEPQGGAIPTAATCIADRGGLQDDGKEEVPC